MSRTQKTGLRSGLVVLVVAAALVGWTQTRTAEASSASHTIVQHETECFIANGKELCRF
jgi:hypothetical protein